MDGWYWRFGGWMIWLGLCMNMMDGMYTCSISSPKNRSTTEEVPLQFRCTSEHLLDYSRW